MYVYVMPRVKTLAEHDMHCLTNSADPDQLASEEAN